MISASTAGPAALPISHRRLRGLLTSILLAIIPGCMGPMATFNEIDGHFPPIPSGHGRVFFYISHGVGSFGQIDGEEVGQFGDYNVFFFADAPAGPHTVSSYAGGFAGQRDAEAVISAGERHFIEVQTGAFLARWSISERSSATAQPVIANCHYYGPDFPGLEQALEAAAATE